MGFRGKSYMFIKKPFSNAFHSSGSDKMKAIWELTAIREKENEDHKYIEGLEKLGDDIVSKNREKGKEVGSNDLIHQIDKKNEFIPYTREDVWKSTLHVSQSLRTKQMDDLLKLDPVYDHFSENNHLAANYKRNLVSTGNVDHIIPFKHSNNKRGLPMDKLRGGEVAKIYPSTACNELTREYRMKGSAINSPTINNTASFSPAQPMPKMLGPFTPQNKGSVTEVSIGKTLKKDKSTPPQKGLHGVATILEEKEREIIDSHENLLKEGHTASIQPSSVPPMSRSSMGSASRRGGSRTYFRRGQHKELKENDKVDKLLKVSFK